MKKGLILKHESVTIALNQFPTVFFFYEGDVTFFLNLSFLINLRLYWRTASSWCVSATMVCNQWNGLLCRTQHAGCLPPSTLLHQIWKATAQAKLNHGLSVISFHSIPFLNASSNSTHNECISCVWMLWLSPRDATTSMFKTKYKKLKIDHFHRNTLWSPLTETQGLQKYVQPIYTFPCKCHHRWPLTFLPVFSQRLLIIIHYRTDCHRRSFCSQHPQQVCEDTLIRVKTTFCIFVVFLNWMKFLNMSLENLHLKFVSDGHWERRFSTDNKIM